MVSAQSWIDTLELALTTKERHALETLGIQTVAELLELNIQKVLSLRGYGEATYWRLRQTQQRLRQTMEAIDASPQLDSSIADLQLGPRGYKALRRLSVETVRDFLAVDLTKPPLIRNCGMVTYAQLIRRQAELRRCFSPKAISRMNDRCEGETVTLNDRKRLAAARKELSAKSWWRLPFFWGKSLGEISPDELHESYCPNTDLGYLGLRPSMVRTLGEEGIANLGRLLLTPWVDLLERGVFRAQTLRNLQQGVEEFFETRLNGPPRRRVDKSSPGAFLQSLLAPVISDKRNLSILLRRLGSDGTPRTLQELGQEHGLTRERIRQICKRAAGKLTTWRAAAALSPLHELILRVLRKKGPLVEISTLCRELKKANHWSKTFHPNVLTTLLPLFPDLRCVDKKYLRLVD